MIVQRRIELVQLMKELNLPLNVVEVGTAEGRLSREIYEQGIDHLYLIDIWETVPFIDGCASFEQSWHNNNYEQVKEAFKDKDNVTLLKGLSYKMAQWIPDESCGMVYIDCDHSYKGVRTDIDYFLPKLVKGGIMAFHDYDKNNSSYGVVSAVWDYTKGNGIVEIPEDGRSENKGAYFIKQ